MLTPLVSIVTANFNKADFIGETIASVIGQTYPNWEWIIVDDCSTDASKQLIEEHLADQRISLVENEINRGGNFCRNLGLSKAKGDYLIFLDADDLLAADCLTRRTATAMEHPGHNLFVFSMGVFYSTPGDSKGAGDWHPTSKQPLKDFLRHQLPWSILQPLWKREVLLQLGGFDETFLRLQDVELNTRALLHSEVSYLLVPGACDCFYRIDEARKNYDFFSFLNRWVDSAIKYCDKINSLVSPVLKTNLCGTIYQTYFQVLYHFKLKQISAGEFSILEQKLLGRGLVKDLNFFKRKLFSISKIYNLYFFRVPGFNRLLKILLVS